MTPLERGFKEMRTTSGKLIGEVDPKRLLLRFKINGEFVLVDLTEYGIKPHQKKRTGPLSNANVLFW